MKQPMPHTVELLLVAAPLAAVLVAGLMGVSVPLMTMDVPAITRVHPLSGFLSSLGILLLGASTAIWYFSAATVAAGYGDAHGPAPPQMLMGAAVSGYMTLDDLFQVHEIIAPRYLGVPDEAVLGLLGIALLIFLQRAWCLPDRTGLFWLLAALAWLGASAGIDLASPWLWRLGDWQYFFEDGAKWVGLCCWLKYTAVYCRWGLIAGRAEMSTAPSAPMTRKNP